MKTIFVTTLISLSLVQSFAAAKTVTDSLVANLNCNNLKVGSILTSIRPTAFAPTNHIPIKNWGFRSGAVNIAACWGMGSTQRKMFYLLRLGEKNAPTMNTKDVLDTIRGTTVNSVRLQSENDNSMQTESTKYGETKLSQYNIVPLQESSIMDEFGRNTGLGFMDAIMKGIDYKIGYDDIHRDFRSEVQRSQELHFFRAGNIGMGAGSGPRSVKENADTIHSLMMNMSANRLSLINLRLKRTVQHIVIPKSYTKDAKGNVWIKAYDSNQPEADQLIYYSKDSGQFYSPQIMGSFVGDYSGTDYTHPLGVFIVDEDERGIIENSLLKYYTRACKN